MIAEPLGALQKRFEDIDIGATRPSATASPASRWCCAARMMQGSKPTAAELMDTIRKKMNGEAEEFVQ